MTMLLHRPIVAIGFLCLSSRVAQLSPHSTAFARALYYFVILRSSPLKRSTTHHFSSVLIIVAYFSGAANFALFYSSFGIKNIYILYIFERKLDFILSFVSFILFRVSRVPLLFILCSSIIHKINLSF